MSHHPRRDPRGFRVPIFHPHASSAPGTWEDPGALAAAIPDGPVPALLHGLALAPWQGPATLEGWRRLAEEAAFPEPPFDPMGLRAAAGAAIVEPDGRVWLVAPTNAFGGYRATFPKGGARDLDLRAAALREAWEESGLRIGLEAFLVDVTRSTSRTRYYLAHRLGGTPAAMGWESQAVLLVPQDRLVRTLNRSVDHEVVAALLASGALRPRTPRA